MGRKAPVRSLDASRCHAQELSEEVSSSRSNWLLKSSRFPISGLFFDILNAPSRVHQPNSLPIMAGAKEEIHNPKNPWLPISADDGQDVSIGRIP